MIINTGGRKDTVQYYTRWLLKRFEEGYVLSRNPLFQHKVTRYELTPDQVDCVVFCSKNYAPILPHINSITERFHTYFHYTITAYGKEIEPGVPGIDESMATLTKLSEIVGTTRTLDFRQYHHYCSQCRGSLDPDRGCHHNHALDQR